MRRTVAVNAIPEPDSHETPYLMPDNVPVARAEQADVEYLCEECSAVLAELSFMTTLSTTMGEADALLCRLAEWWANN